MDIREHPCSLMSLYLPEVRWALSLPKSMYTGVTNGETGGSSPHFMRLWQVASDFRGLPRVVRY